MSVKWTNTRGIGFSSENANGARRISNRVNVGDFVTAMGQILPEIAETTMKEIGELMLDEVQYSITSANLKELSKPRVASWQQAFYGVSKYGNRWAAVRPVKNMAYLDSNGKGKRWNGDTVTTHDITAWLEYGHGVRTKNIKDGYTKALQFYSLTKTRIGWGLKEVAIAKYKRLFKELTAE